MPAAGTDRVPGSAAGSAAPDQYGDQGPHSDQDEDQDQQDDEPQVVVAATRSSEGEKLGVV